MLKDLTNVERFVFGVLIIGGYFSIGIVGAIVFKNNEAGLRLTENAQLTIGPLIGIIVQSIWKTSQVDKVNADTAAKIAAKAPDNSGALTVGDATITAETVTVKKP